MGIKVRDKMNRVLGLRNFAGLVMVIALLFSFQAQALAQQANEPASRPERGAGSYGSYAVSDLEVVNLSNGNVTLTIPLASLAPVGGGKLGWQFKATYNSKVWDMRSEEHPPDAAHIGRTYTTQHLQVGSQGGWKIAEAYGMTEPLADQEVQTVCDGLTGPPHEQCIDAMAYRYKRVFTMPDGATHELRPLDYTAYNGVGNQTWRRGYYKDTPSNTGSSMRYYSIDGSFLWAKIYPSGSTLWEVYMPDGSHIIQRNNGVQKLWDTNGNVIEIHKTTDAFGVITTRCIDVGAEPDREIKYIYDPQGNGGAGRGEVQYQSVGGTWVSIIINFGNITLQGLVANINDRACDKVAEEIGGTQIQIVNSIVLPQTEPGMTRQFTFTYNQGIETLPVPMQYTLVCDAPTFSSSSQASKGWGELSRVEMPTGAIVEYDYEMDSQQASANTLTGARDVPRNRVKQKRLIHDGGTDTWNYIIGSASGRVDAPDGSSVTESCFNHDPRFPSQMGGSDGFAGQVYRSNHSDKVIIERRWAHLPFSGANNDAPDGIVGFNTVMTTEFTTLREGGVDLKMSAKVFEHDYNGNLTKETDYDWFDPSLVNGCRDTFGVPTCVPASATVLRVLNNSYYNPGPVGSDPGSVNVYGKRDLNTITPLILNAPQETSLSDSGLQPMSRTQFTYDNQAVPTKGNLTTESRWLKFGSGSRWIDVTHEYDSYGNRTKTVTPSGAGLSTTMISYDINTHAQPVQVTVDPQNGTGQQNTSTTYDFYTGLPLTQTDVNGKVTNIDYSNQVLKDANQIVQDPYFRPGAVTSPAVATFDPDTGQSSTTQAHKTVSRYYDSARQVETRSDLKITGDGKLRSRSSADQLGRSILTETSEDGATYTISAQSVYQQMGRITFSSNPKRAASAMTDGWTRTTLDDTGRVVEVATFATPSLPPTSGTNANWTGSVTTSYYANSTTVTDQAGKQRRSIVDGLGRLIRIDEPDLSSETGVLDDSNGLPLQPTIYGYDALGNLKTVTQGGQLRAFNYDSFSRLKEAFNPEQVNTSNVKVATSYTYDDASNLTRKDNPNGTFLTFTYDGLNRAKTKTLSTGDTWNYTYDVGVTNPKGRLVSVTRQGGDGTYYDGYDGGGRLLSSRQITTAGGAQSYTTSYAYDLAGNLTREVYPSGKEYRTSYDNAGRVATVTRYNGSTLEKSYVSSFGYTAHGAMKSKVLGNGLVENIEYNSRLQPEHIKLGTTSLPSSKVQFDYTYGTSASTNNGNVSSQTISAPKPDNTTAVMSQNYTYDSLNRLKMASENGTWSQTYDYDRFGNRAVRAGSSIPMPALTPTSTVTGDLSAAFDVNTNRIKVSGYNYDFSGNLLSDPTTSANAIFYDSENKQTSYSKAGATTIYTYDADGRRVKKVEPGNLTTVFVYDAMGKMLAEYHSDPVPPAQAGGGTSYLTTDALSSTRVVTGANGQVKSRRDYLPFGEEITSAIPIGVRNSISEYGAMDGQRNRFTGHERDDESGMDYMKARYCSSAQGRFTSIDPLRASAHPANPQSWNRFTYVLNRPLIAVDPEGLSVIIVFVDAKRHTDDNTGKSVRHSTTLVLDGNGHFLQNVGSDEGRFKTLSTGNSPNRAAKNGDTPFGSYTILPNHNGGNQNGTLGGEDGKMPRGKAYGTGILYLKPEAGEAKDSGRDSIYLHGGGSSLGNKASEPQQELGATHGCVRCHNEDINTLVNTVNNLAANGDPVTHVFIGTAQYIDRLANEKNKEGSYKYPDLRIAQGYDQPPQEKK